MKCEACRQEREYFVPDAALNICIPCDSAVKQENYEMRLKLYKDSLEKHDYNGEKNAG
jgi:hypothetical protein